MQGVRTIKIRQMKTNSTQREILLVTNNSFAHQQWCNKDNGANNSFSAAEQMEEICANGLIYELLPEVFESPENKKMYLWQMHPGFAFLQLEYGELPLAIDKAKSIDPHNSLSYMCYN
jgi:hypothetical protein